MDISKLKTISHFAEIKKISRQHVYRLEEQDKINIVRIDGVAFVLMDSKADSFQLSRVRKKL